MRAINKVTSAAAVAGLAVALLPGVAAAAPSAGPGPVVTARPGVGKSKVSVRDVITCKITAHNPHYSHHAHAADKHRVNVTADVKCSKKVASIRLKVVLYKNGQKYKESGWKTATGKNRVSQNAARRCVKKQTYRAQALATVAFPPGYRPPTASGTAWSASVRINACKKS
ncbi:hypothetical protein [Actinomadura atramentaria]|uniref:hypothetical protein n=1 Tax=Actinomadura atramentaria TaxID=1990 RepID=UPI00037FF09B|nr:hypothetical protein [Actinomadura atramentaria]